MNLLQDFQVRASLARPREGAVDHGRRDAGAGHRRQRRDLQRRARRAAAPLVNRDESRLLYIRQSAPGHRRRERHLLGPGDPAICASASRR